ncbi:hypothetical protein BH92_15400 [Rhodococcoides fascians A21d2]|uniref:hypothetical protein n=1 Tax=Rhodococcoides fascians TaxID=1828 RepID=UPI000A3ED019|nr:hypothetical protein [Rhodococcus fascians]QII01075.1 hypothetical protein BH92_15400 [Rhodococcus fascians A21d2]
MANQVKIQIKATADTGVIKQVQAQLAALKDKRVKVHVDIDKSSMRALDDLKRNRIKVEVDQESIRQLREQTQRVRVDLDEAGYRGQIETLTRPRVQTVVVRTNGRSVATTARTIKALGRTIQGTTVAAALLGTAAIGLGSAAVASPIALAAAFGAAGVAGGALSTVITAGIAGGLIASAARAQEVRDHFSYMANDVSTAMKGVTQNLEQPLVRTATALGAAFYAVEPSLRRVSGLTEGLLNQFNDTLPAIADQAGPAFEKMFNAGLPGMQKLIATMPRITEAFGNFFQTLGDSAEVQNLIAGFIEGIPGGIESVANFIDKAAKGYYKIKEFWNSDDMKPMREGLERFAENFSNIDWSRASQGFKDLMNSTGDLFGNIDLQDAADTIGEIAGGLSNVVDFIDGIGLKAAILGGIGAYIAGGILAAFGRQFAKALAGKIAGALLGGAITDAVETVADTVSDILGNAIGNAIGTGIGAFLGNLAGSWLADLFKNDDFDVNVNIKEVNWPDGSDSLDIKAKISSVEMPADLAAVNIVAKISGLEGLPTSGNAIAIPVTYIDPGFVAAAQTLTVPVVYSDPGFAPAAVTVPIVWGPLPEIPTPPAVTVPLEVDTSGIAGQISGVSIPSVEVPVTVNTSQNGRTFWDFARGFLDNATAQLEAIVTLSYEAPEQPTIPPVEVNVNYKTDGVTLPVPPPVTVPVNFTIPPLNIPVPPAVQVPVSFNIEAINIPTPPAVNVQVTSNASAVAAELNGIPKSLQSTHTVTTNAAAARAEIMSLNGLNTSSTHTINTVRTGDTGEGAPR